MIARRSAALAALVATLLALAGCGSDAAGGATEPGAGGELQVEVPGLPALNPADGSYAVWLVSRTGSRHLAGTLTGASGRFRLAAEMRGSVVEVTVEPSRDSDPGPSAALLLRGEIRGGRATLSAHGAVTVGELPLRVRPGQFTLFTPSDNHSRGYPSDEHAGIWLFNTAPRVTEQNDAWVRLTQLSPDWLYEGWAVRDFGTPGAVWLSYGKFRPDAAGVVNQRDDTGWGPFSGVLDFLTAGEEEFPGDDWISNPLNFPVPGNLTLPLNLQEKTATGAARWSHVLSVEPARDQGEPVGREQPFVLQLYRDPIGDGRPGTPQTITLRGELPRGTATLR